MKNNILKMIFSRGFLFGLAVVLMLLADIGYADTSLTTETKDGKTYYRLKNERVSMLIDPAQGGAVVSYKDKLGGDVDLIPDKNPHGLCIDHFQSQYWPGEMFKAKYEVTEKKNNPKECVLSFRYKVTGWWKNSENEKLKDLIVEKTYKLRAGNPALECRIKITAPRKDSKLFAYWQQHIFYAGGQFDRKLDQSFRPSSRGVRVKAREDWGHTGPENFLRDPSAGWMALIDAKQKTGLVVLSNYDEIDVLYTCGGNTTLEPMYRITYLPAGKSVEYPIYIVPVIGLDDVVSATENYIAGYQMNSDGKGSGKIELSAVRSVNAPKSLQMKVEVMNVLKPGKTVSAGTATFDALTEKPQTRELSFKDAGGDPLVLKVKTSTKNPEGSEVITDFEEYYNGTWKWGENLKTDMITPIYRGERPKQKLTLHKPKPLKLVDIPGVQMWYAEGLLDDQYRLGPSAHMTHMFRDGNSQDRHDREFTSYSSNWQTRLSGFPYDYDKLLSYDMIILGGVKRVTLGNICQEMLCDYLKAGGGMIVLGGPMAYGGSKLKDTPLAEMLPVTMEDTPFDMEKLPDAVIKPTREGAPFLEDLNWKQEPRVLYIHRVKVKPWGKTVLEANGHPFLVTGEVGPNKARVVCIMGVPMGSFDEDEIPFWKWDDWKYLLRQLNWWVMKQDYRFDYKKHLW